MKTFLEYLNLLPLDEAAKKAKDEWSPPLAGADITRHLGKSHVRGIVSDEWYTNHVKHAQHFPVFRVAKGEAGYRKVKVGNTLGDHHIEYTINQAGTVTRKTLYHRASGIHPAVHWGVGETWKIEDELAKKKAKKK
jgi:hypothetical protein